MSEVRVGPPCHEKLISNLTIRDQSGQDGQFGIRVRSRPSTLLELMLCLTISRSPHRVCLMTVYFKRNLPVLLYHRRLIMVSFFCRSYKELVDLITDHVLSSSFLTV